jgi:Bacterial Ig domain
MMNWRVLLASLLFFCLIDGAVARPPHGGGPQAPPEASGVGYSHLAFDDEFTTIATLDVNCTNVPGFNWYLEQWFSAPQSCTSPSNVTVGNGYLTVLNQGIESAVATLPSPPYYVGNVFANGAYFEASLRFNPALGAGTTYWPSFWSIAMEHIQDNKDGQAAEQWPGQVNGYAHFIEPDFFEACCGGSYVGIPFYYASLIDWSGVFQGAPIYLYPYRTGNFGTPGNQFTPTGVLIDWNSFHTYGCLWVPQNGATPGYIQYFFDHIPTARNYYTGPIGNPPLPGQNGFSGSWNPNTSAQAAATFAIVDQQHLAMSLATAGGWPLQVEWVHVWQAVGTPSASITSPGPSATVSGTVAINVTAFDTVQMSNVQFYVDNSLINTPVAESGWSTAFTTNWNSTVVPDGTHTLKAVAINAAGVTSVASETVTTSNYGAPAAPVITGPSGTVYGVPVVTGTGITGDTVSVFSDGAFQGSDLVVAGAWSLVMPQPLSGAHNITATQKTLVSAPSAPSNTEAITRAILPNTTVVTSPNLVQYPTSYSSSYWTNHLVSTSGGVVLPPDGSTQSTMQAIIDTSGNSTHWLSADQLNAFTPGIYTMGVYLKQGTLRYAAIKMQDNGNNYGVIVDLQAGTASVGGSPITSGSPTNTAFSITACPDTVACPNGPSGVYYVTISMSVAGTAENLYPEIYDMNGPSASSNLSYVGSSGYNYAWGVQITYPQAITASTTQPPWLANGAGCTTNTFSSHTFSASTVDLGLTGNPGFQWYLIGSFTFANYNPANYTFNPDGSMTMVGSGVYSIAAKQTPVTAWKGTAFGASGCTYYEATFVIDPTSVNPYSGGHGWQAWWSDPVEHGAEQSVNAENWIGATTGYVHYQEKDFYEYNQWLYDLRLEANSGTVIDWSGIYSSGYPFDFQNSGNRQITDPIATDPTKPHSYGFLQVNATTTSLGYYQWFYDRRPTSDIVYYTKFSCTNPPAPPMTSSGVAVNETTNAGTASGSPVIHFSGAPASDVLGSVVTDTTHPAAIPANTLAASISGGNITLTNNVTATTVSSGDTIVFTAGLYGIGDCLHDELILNSASIGAMTIYDVEVWQASGSNNITQ